MIIPEQKKTAALIVAKMGPKGMEQREQEGPKEEEIDPDQEGLRAAAEDIMAAIKGGSAHDLAMALHDFYEMCEAKEAPAEDNQEEDEQA